MNNNLISAVFDSRSEAEAAAADLRSAGISDDSLSVIARREGAEGDYGDADTHEVKEKGEGLAKGVIGGGVAGALLGIAALAIPGVGPLAAAGAIASRPSPKRPPSAPVLARLRAALRACSPSTASATKTPVTMKSGSIRAACSCRSTPARPASAPTRSATSSSATAAATLRSPGCRLPTPTPRLTEHSHGELVRGARQRERPWTDQSREAAHEAPART